MNIGDKIIFAADDEVAKKDNPVIEGSLSLGRKRNTTVGNASVAMGLDCEASKERAVAVGNYCTASGKYSFAANNNCQAIQDRATAFGQSTKASSPDQFVCGKYNEEDKNSNNLFIVGKGTSSVRSNAFAVSKNGDGVFSGNVTDGRGNSMNALAQSVLALQNMNKYGVRFKVSKLLRDDTFVIRPNMIILVQTSSGGRVVCNNAASPITFNDLAFVFSSGYENDDSDVSTGSYRCIVMWKTGTGVLGSTDMKTCVHHKDAEEYYIQNTDDVNMWISYVEREE